MNLSGSTSMPCIRHLRLLHPTPLNRRSALPYLLPSSLSPPTLTPLLPLPPSSPPTPPGCRPGGAAACVARHRPVAAGVGARAGPPVSGRRRRLLPGSCGAPRPVHTRLYIIIVSRSRSRSSAFGAGRADAAGGTRPGTGGAAAVAAATGAAGAGGGAEGEVWGAAGDCACVRGDRSVARQTPKTVITAYLWIVHAGINVAYVYTCLLLHIGNHSSSPSPIPRPPPNTHTHTHIPAQSLLLVPVSTARKLVAAQPGLLSHSPEVLRARLSGLCGTFNVDTQVRCRCGAAGGGLGVWARVRLRLRLRLRGAQTGGADGCGG